ncbi:IS110 family RNA-guided transposase [Carnobacterium mobile]|uniref:IS110 family transposase n=1 Tax=Carnobacterium mobile TaxID=2750 RepID=UPI0018686340|nr:IS110 family transposase [Carnobacterium mobile]
MEVMVETCCGIDVHQKSIVCCILSGPLDTNKPHKLYRTFGTTTKQLYQALNWLNENHVTHVFFESTGQYWVPLFNIFSDSSLELILANPQHIKNLPGRKTDMNDAEWIAQLGRCGLIQASYIPNAEVQQLRLLTRRRKAYTERITQCKNEIHNILQQANIKLTSYLSDIYGKTGTALLQLFIDGVVISVESIMPILHGKVKASPEKLVEAMDGKLSIEDRFLLGQSLDYFQFLKAQLNEVQILIEKYIQEHFPLEYALLLEIPGVSKIIAAVILGEIGPNVEAFVSEAHLASWAGVCPGSYESAGVKKSSRTTQGNRFLKTALFQAGGTAGRSKDEGFHSFYGRISNRGSKMKAIIACAHKLLRIIYKILSTKCHYDTKKALGLRQQTRAIA